MLDSSKGEDWNTILEKSLEPDWLRARKAKAANAYTILTLCQQVCTQRLCVHTTIFSESKSRRSAVAKEWFSLENLYFIRYRPLPNTRRLCIRSCQTELIGVQGANIPNPRNPWLKTEKLVAKPDQMIGGRGKAGLIAVPRLNKNENHVEVFGCCWISCYEIGSSCMS